MACDQSSGLALPFQRQIETTDKQIDALVYELYGLTEEEIGVVEGEQTFPYRDSK